MNLIVNSLPTRTWNHLRMNETRVNVEGEWQNLVPEARFDREQIRWTEHTAWDREIPEGLSAGITEILEPLGTSLAETEAGVRMDAPLCLTYRFGPDRRAADLVLHAQKGSRLQAVLLLESQDPEAGEQAMLRTRVYADEGAQVDLFIAQLLGDSASILEETGGICEAGARINLTRLDLGGKTACSGANIDLLGADSSFSAETAYHARAGQRLDMNDVALHHGPRTESLMEVNGTLENGASKIFRGTIDFQRGCPGARGTENEHVLLMGDDVVNQTIPLILCKEEDVEGNHGASIGKLDDKVLFYLGSRGIAPEDAQRIISQARIEAICGKIPDEAVRNAVHDYENRRGNSHDTQL